MTQSNNLKISEPIAFADAIVFTQSLLAQMEEGKLSESEIEGAIASLVKSRDGARGFFVAYLTDERSLADNPSPAVISALKSAPNIISELLAKNIAMSSAMALTHRRDRNEEMAQGSDRVSRRSANLIQKLQLDLVYKELEQLRQSITTGKGNYQSFLERWDYDSEQKQVMEKVLSQFE